MKRSILLILLTAALLCGCSEQGVTGEVEAVIRVQPSETAGKVLEVPVSLGQTVKAGDVLAVLDDTAARFTYEQMEQTLLKKQAVLEDLQEGAAKEQIQQGRNTVTIAAAEYQDAQLRLQRAQTELARQTTLWESGALPQSTLERYQDEVTAAEKAITVAAAQHDTAQQQLNYLLEEQVSEPQLRSAVADVTIAESQLAQLQTELDKYKITAQADGVIISLLVREGELVTAGTDIADISSSSEQYLVVYWPVKRLNQVTYGQQVAIVYDGQQETGTISFLDIHQQYTPKDQQNSLNKNQESVKMKVRLAEDTALKPGQQAQVMLLESNDNK